jgi:thiamine phosphate synthase YjbQ (UPF0047 family)
MIRLNVKTVELHYKKPDSSIHLTDITRQVEHSIIDSKMNDGIAIIHTNCPNACITTMEYEPGTISDMQEALEKLIPLNGHNGKPHANGNGVANGNHKSDSRPSMMLGKWQKVVLIDFDASIDEKKVIVQIIGEK